MVIFSFRKRQSTFDQILSTLESIKDETRLIITSKIRFLL